MKPERASEAAYRPSDRAPKSDPRGGPVEAPAEREARVAGTADQIQARKVERVRELAAKGRTVYWIAQDVGESIRWVQAILGLSGGG